MTAFSYIVATQEFCLNDSLDPAATASEDGCGSFKIAHMSTGDKIGVEMFEFKNNESPKDFEYWKTSTFHFCVQDPDVEGLVEKIVAHGGKQRMPIREYYPGEKPYRMVYVEDPFGLIFEVYSHSYELTYSQGAY